MAVQTIAISGRDYYRRVEGVTDETVTPGYLMELGGSNDVQAHSTANGLAEKMFALENDLVGGDIDDDYASGETVQLGIFQSGAEVRAYLAHGENASAGSYLSSDGTGALQVTTTVGQAVAVATEALNNTSGSISRISVRVL